MLYDIRLSIDYHYDAAADSGRHVLRMLPRTIEGVQRVVAASLDCDPLPVERSDRVDFFGNAVSTLRYDRPLERESFLMRARVERLPGQGTAGAPTSLGALPAELAVLRDIGPDSPQHYLAPSPRVGFDAGVTDWAMTTTAGASDVRDAAWRVCSGLHAEMAFDPEVTAVDTPLAEAFAARHGVCQDFTHIMIGALRVLGIPAGYVSGFLRTNPPEGQARLEGADAMHAWVRAWCGRDAGWIEFDPTNDMVAGEDHVVVAFGRDYFDVAPIKGNMRTSGGQKSRQRVDMIPQDEGGPAT
ncbi:transglutaminase family protein [Maritimibacter sp. DP1N21-5]|uniref:transglutaminase family protein n=1 Tax=Maritimibacter sp. DP1N21-5 TaxID=2836867 RepID=UPI001C4644A2|nr:transglutaminase family protein [Maritimibacter sp. DP1N21-5]MBV7409210.1 transglutaminase family protein [Maritimibacter sp. DP1N21-5]